MKYDLIEKSRLVSVIEKKDFLRLIYEFNRIPASYIHSSWIEPMMPYNLFLRISETKRGLIRISKLISEKYNLEQDFYSDFYESRYRWALLPSDVLHTLTLFGGIALNHQKIRALIRKDDKKTFIDNIGEQGYRFAVDSASLLIGNIGNQVRFTGQWENLKSYVEKCGVRLFLSAFENVPEHIFLRLLLKFDKNHVENNDVLKHNLDPSMTFAFFIRIVKQVVDRQWLQYIA